MRVSRLRLMLRRVLRAPLPARFARLLHGRGKQIAQAHTWVIHRKPRPHVTRWLSSARREQFAKALAVDRIRDPAEMAMERPSKDEPALRTLLQPPSVSQVRSQIISSTT